MRLMRKRSVLLVALSLGSTVAIVIGVQGAAGAPAAMHVKVTGRDYASQLSVKPLPDVPGVLDRRREVWGGRDEMSDPRVTGRYRSAFNTWEYSDGRAHFADMTFSLTNAKGAWKGSSIGVRGTDGSHFIRGVSYGAGHYQGLRYVVILYDKASGTAGTHLLDVDGWIERVTAAPPVVESTDEVHVKVTGKSTPAQVLPATGQRAGTERTSDPRTTGAYRGTMKLYRYSDGRMHFFGTYALENEQGTWEGDWYGVVTRDRRYIQFVDAVGTGAFEGLRYRHVDVGRYPKSSPKTVTLAVNGWIESVESSS